MKPEEDTSLIADASVPTSPPEQVILVHGTFAGEEADTGQKWWQQDSHPWRHLKQELPPGIQMAQVFHWKEGPNSYRARVRAGRQLLDRLLHLEKMGQAYHLIGHSHGGSVIWECLQWATILGSKPSFWVKGRHSLTLPNLRSWTTVATPFIDFVPHKVFWSLERTKKEFGRPTKKPSHLRRLFSHPRKWAHRYMDVVNFFFVMIIVLMCLAAPIGLWLDYRSGKDVNFMFFPIVLIMASFAALLSIWNISQAEFENGKEERGYRNLSLQQFGQKWLGLYSTHDEAIRALKTSVGLNLSLIPSRVGTERVFYSDEVFPLTSWIFSQWNKLYNLVVPWIGNRFISTHIARAIQGADRPASLAIDVRTHPGFHEDVIQALPEKIDRKLVELANHRAAALIPHLRSLLYTFSENPLHVTTDHQIDATGGLVHNSYFDVQEVLAILILHIRLTTAQPLEKPQTDSSLVEWIHMSKQQFAQHLSE